MRVLKKRWFALLLTLVMVLQSVLPCTAAEPEEESGEYYIGKLWVYTQDAGKRQVRAALYGEEHILAEPEVIASLAGAAVSRDENSLEFRRGSYAVRVEETSGQAEIGLYVDEQADWRLYPDEDFLLENIHRLDDSGEERLFLPLEEMLYLLNVQWMCDDQCVYCYAPAETLWNVVGDIKKQVASLPSRDVIFGASEWEHAANGFMFGVLAVGDDIDLSFATPFAEKNWDLKKTEQALLTLAAPCANLDGSLRSDAEWASADFVGGLADFISDVTALGGGTDLPELMGQVFTSWSQIQVPAYLKNGIAFASVGNFVKAQSVAARYLDWTNGYVEQLQYLSQLQNERYPDDCEHLNKVAKSLISECGNLTGNQVWETGKAALDTLVTAIAGEVSPAGLAFSTYNAAIVGLKGLLPALGDAFETGEDISDAMRLCNLAAVLRSEYGDVLESSRGQAETLDDLKKIRQCGKLLSSAGAHSYDALYSAMRTLVLDKLGYGASEEQIRAYTVMGKSMDELAQKLIQNQTFVLRFQETEQYDPSLLLIDSFANLYSDTAGAYREKIPPEYVLYDLPMRFSAGMGEYGGVVYKLGEALEVEGISVETLPVAAPKYDRICSFLFYRGRLYFCCKDGGTDGYHSALYSCRPDGSDMILLKEDCVHFYIVNNRLYPWGPEYLDLEDEEWKNDEEYTSPGFDSWWEEETFRLDATTMVGITYIPIEEQADGSRVYGKAERLVSMDNRHGQIDIQTVAGGLVFFTYYKDDKDMLYCCDMETGKVTLLDEKRVAGSGTYFGW